MATTNMNLPIPTVSTTSGPTWATNINSCFTLIDAHDHSAGSGVQITPDGLNINSDLSFTSNNATALRSSRYTSQASPLSGGSDLSCVYVSGGDLYFNDSSANQIQITSGGGVAGTPGSIGSLTSPASANYVSASTKFTWLADTAKYAAMEFGGISIFETNVASSNSVSVVAPGSLAASYTFTLPTALPGSSQYMTSSAAGALSFSSADSIGSAMTSTGANAVAATRTRSTGTSVSAGGVAISSSSGSFAGGSATFADVTGLSVTITTSGRPVVITLASDGSGSLTHIGQFNGAGNSSRADFQILRDSTVVGTFQLSSTTTGTSTNTIYTPSGTVFQVDAVSAGTYVYKLQYKLVTGTSVDVYYTKLVAYEL